MKLKDLKKILLGLTAAFCFTILLPISAKAEEEMDVCEECAANAAHVTELELAGVEEVYGDALELCEEETLYSPRLTATQQSIVDRARAQYNLVWTAQYDLQGWNNQVDSVYTFRQGTTYNGVPYGQPVSGGKWVGYDVTNAQFLTVANTPGSFMYIKTGYYLNYTFPYYSNDCSTYVSYCWGLTNRNTTRSLPYCGVQQTDSLYELRVGDALVKAGSHTICIEELKYKDTGELAQITVLEQTPPKTKRSIYSGKDGVQKFADKYFGSGYHIYRLASVISELKNFDDGLSVTKLPFIDVNRGDWYYDSVQYVFEHGIMTGMNSSEFGSANTLKRAQMAQIIYNMNDQPQCTYVELFYDTPQGAWFEPAVTWCAKTGIVKGYASGNFGANDSITREQMAIMLYRYAGAIGYDTSKRADLSQFQDVYMVSDWASEELRWAVAEGIINGKNGGTLLDPSGHTTRAEAATMMMRFDQKF